MAPGRDWMHADRQATAQSMVTVADDFIKEQDGPLA